MKLPNYVKPKPKLLGILPMIGNRTANSIYPFILLPKTVYEALLEERPDPRLVALLIHEETHRNRQKKMGWFKFGIKYIFDKRFRFNEELLAVKEGMKYLKKNNIAFDFEKNAKHLSGWLYLWPVSKNYAKEELERIWNEV